MSLKNSNMKAVRMSTLEEMLSHLPVHSEEEYEVSDDESPDRSYSDGEVYENRSFYTSVKNDSTYPSNNVKESCFADTCSNQTYPSKDLLSCSGGKHRQGKTGVTPVQTPRKVHPSGSSSKSKKQMTPMSRKTPKSSNKKTPRFQTKKSASNSSAKKTTPFRKCLSTDDAFKSSTKCSLFSSNKSQQNSMQCARASSAVKPEEMFASALQITEDPKNSSQDDKNTWPNPFGISRHNVAQQSKCQDVFATPKTNITSNSVLKSCRENFVTPLKPNDISGTCKYETPSTQNKSSHFANQRTPLFPIKERSDPTSKNPSMKKHSLSAQKQKENQPSCEKDSQSKKSLFNDKAVLKEVDIINRLSEVVHETGKNKSQDVPPRNLSSNQIFCDSLHTDDKRKNVDIFQEISGDFKFREDHHYFSQKKLKNTEEKRHVSNAEQCQRNSVIIESHNPVIIVSEAHKEPHRTISELDGGVSSKGREVPNRVVSLQQPNRWPQQVNQKQAVQRQSAQQQQQQLVQLQQQLILQQPVIEQPLQRQFRTLSVKGKRYTVLGIIGSGGSSEVFKVLDPEDSTMYAVKCVNLAVEQSMAQGYINEIKLLQSLQGSDRVITMYDYEYIERQRKLYVVLEMGDVDLSSLMKGYRQRETRLPLPIIVCYWTEMLTAVHHIHQNNIIHSDLKPANFLLVHGRLKLIDFGIASSLNAEATSIVKETTTGTFNYISPEAVNAGMGPVEPVKISYKSDVWSLGCILYSMLYGRTPFSHYNQIWGKIAALTNPNMVIDFPQLQGVPPVLMHALKWCLTYDVKMRPTVQELIDLPYISRTDEVAAHPPTRKVPLQIMAKVKAALNAEEWKCIVDVLEGK